MSSLHNSDGTRSNTSITESTNTPEFKLSLTKKTGLFSRETYCALFFLIWCILSFPYYIHGEQAIWLSAPMALYLLDASVIILIIGCITTIMAIICKCFDVKSFAIIAKFYAVLLMIAVVLHIISSVLLIDDYCYGYLTNYSWQCMCIVSGFNLGYFSCTLLYFSLIIFGMKGFADNPSDLQFNHHTRVVYLSAVVLFSNALILAKEFDLQSDESKAYNGLKAGLMISCIASIASIVGIWKRALSNDNRLLYFAICSFFLVGGFVALAYTFPTLISNGSNVYAKLSAIGYGWLQLSVNVLVVWEILSMVKNMDFNSYVAIPVHELGR